MHRRNRLRLALGCLVWLAAAAPLLGQGPSEFERRRNRMVDEEIVAAGVRNERVIEAMRTTPRHEFVSTNQRKYAYYDMALPIGESQTISPPFVVASMTEAIDPRPEDKVLEIGTGSGYQAAVLSPLVRAVYSIEIVPELGRNAARTLKRLRYDNVFTKIGDGYQGWPEHAPFDKIIVTCSPEKVPPALVAQLREGGRMVIPVGERYQQTMFVLEKRDGRLQAEALRPTLFVPMSGRAERKRQVMPDPANPTLANGDFEELLSDDPPMPAGWHYQRQLELVRDDTAPEGKRYATFRNAESGRGCQALQGFAVDGRRVGYLRFSLRVKGEGIRPGQTPRQMPVLAVTFYDERRATVGHRAIGPWRGTFSWQPEAALLDVPLQAREAIVRIGLLGAVGAISFDAIKMEAVAR